MRTHKPLLPLILLLITIPACHSTQSSSMSDHTFSQLERVETGMTPTEVRRALGPPEQTIPSTDTVQWMEYGSSIHRFRIYFDNNRVKALPTPSPSR